MINGETRIPFVRGTGTDEQIDAVEELISGIAPQTLNRSGTVLAFINSRGLVDIQPKSAFAGEPLIISTSIKSPRGIIYSPDERHLVAFNDHRFALLSSEQGKYFNDVIPLYSLRKEASSAHGISKMTFSGDSNTIIVTGSGGIEVRYDLDGNEIK